MHNIKCNTLHKSIYIQQRASDYHPYITSIIKNIYFFTFFFFFFPWSISSISSFSSALVSFPEYSLPFLFPAPFPPFPLFPPLVVSFFNTFTFLCLGASSLSDWFSTRGGSLFWSDWDSGVEWRSVSSLSSILSLASDSSALLLVFLADLTADLGGFLYLSPV
jgi:hypothetical protein